MHNVDDFTPVVGNGATLCGWSDRKAHTITRVSKSGNVFWMRRDQVKLLNGVNSGHAHALTFTPGGFFGHTEGAQFYEYAASNDGAEIRVSMTKRGWKVGGARGSSVIEGRHEHYDFNF